jgi:hydroxypyruvate reductase
VVGAGKAAAAMAAAVEAKWPEGAPLEGVVITRYRHGLPTRRIRVVEAGHPVPDESGQAAAGEILERARALDADDLLLVLVSGGGSALLALPAEGVTIADLKDVTVKLLASGAPIQDMNTVRKHLSAIQGGRLAAATRARVVALVISDVTGDDPTHIGSGPCAPDPTTYRDALDILARFGVEAPASIRERLEAGARGAIAETPKPGRRALCARRKPRHRDRAPEPARRRDLLPGPRRSLAHPRRQHHRRIERGGEGVRRHCTRSPPARPPGEGAGGAHLRRRDDGDPARRRPRGPLHGVPALPRRGLGRPAARMGDRLATPMGIDGSEDNAGALLAPDALLRAGRLGLAAKKMLADNDGYGFFSALGDLVVTGPTRTNVNDFRVILLEA